MLWVKTLFGAWILGCALPLVAMGAGWGQQGFSDKHNVASLALALSDHTAFDDTVLRFSPAVRAQDSLRGLLMQGHLEYDPKRLEAHLAEELRRKDAQALEELRRRDMERRMGIAALMFMVVVAFVFLLQRNRISREKDRSEQLLLNILPKAIVQELKEKGKAEPRVHVNATVLFSDFKGFTEISERLPAKELVDVLDTYFRAYDEVVHKHGLEKIKTIGDAYMAASGLRDSRDANTVEAVRAALELVEVTDRIYRQLLAEGRHAFQIRVGISSGPVVAGVVGEHKFQYDIWGDTVNTAARMETTGEVGKVNISETTYQLVKDHFACTYRGEVEAKGKGQIKMYFVDHELPAGG